MRAALASTLAVVLASGILCGVAFAHVSIPAGAPTGVANQGTRAYSVAVGLVTGGGPKVQLNAGPKPTDTSMHFHLCWNEGQPTEKDEKKAGGTFTAGSVKSGSAGFPAPAGATSAHWVITWDEDGTIVFAAEGTVNL